ncbi:Protein of unknown function [Persephonella hydrogeniphila]|uniref:DUF1538 domain-containing protein n=1 Tax=Persephonella hydrogeniphila TaxID=198703 RepID=A0A285NKA3_9AQUI|nr:DUF1538 domain-containing protein [Persephonella hydrogeniphila]SNZ09922.1 Protein of unknown function [Persephonella hydrogeniphila]
MTDIKLFLRLLKDSVRDLIPIILVIVVFQFLILQQIPDNIFSIILGLSIVVFGLAIFIQGLEVGIFPLGENLANEFAKKGSLFWLLLFSFFIGFSTTIAEPALIAIADKAEIISFGKIDAFWLRFTVALSVGLAIALGVLRIILGHPIQWYIIVGYIIVVLITFFAPPEIVGLAYDSGGVTTSTVTVPLVTALGIGLASSIRGRNPVIDGFGLIAFASLTPMIFVQIYGILVYVISGEPAQIQIKSELSLPEVTYSEHKPHWILEIVIDFLGIIKDVAPILGVIFFFQYFIIKKSIPHPKKIFIGVLFVIFGLYAFIVGLEMGLFPLGEGMAFQLTQKGTVFLIYLFGFLIGFSTTMAEPALIAVALKAKEVSAGRINDFILRIFVALGVAVGIALGCYRIVAGDSIHYYIIVGYVIVIIMTYFAPRYIIPIAYDSGGVTTSTVTVPLVAALGLGLATNIPGRDPLIDGFGLIAFASLFPIITVMGYGILAETILKRAKEGKR